MTTRTLDTKVEAFLGLKRIAVAGVSRDSRTHAAATAIYRRLKGEGRAVFAVNPRLTEFEGDPCYPDLKSIPGGVGGVVIVTKPQITEEIVRQCSGAGVGHVWMHASSAKGSSVSPGGGRPVSSGGDRGDRRRLSHDVWRDR